MSSLLGGGFDKGLGKGFGKGSGKGLGKEFGKGSGKGFGKGLGKWTKSPGGGFSKQYPPGYVGVPYGFYPGYGRVY